MKVYLAGPYAARDQIRLYAAELTEQGIECTSTWLEETHEINNQTTGAAVGLPDADVDGHARQDIADINRSDVLVLFTSAYVHKEGGGGRHVETGYALAISRKVIVVGEPENVFHRLSLVERYPDWAQTKQRLIGLAELAAEHADIRARNDAHARRIIDVDGPTPEDDPHGHEADLAASRQYGGRP